MYTPLSIGLLTVDHSKPTLPVLKWLVGKGEMTFKSADRQVDYLTRLLHTSEGRDKAFKLVQYAAQTTAYFVKEFVDSSAAKHHFTAAALTGLSEFAFRLTKGRAAASTARKWLKLTASLTMLRLAMQVLSVEKHPWLRLFSTGRLLSLALHLSFDHLVLFIKIGVMSGKNRQTVERAACYFIILAICFTVPLDLITLKRTLSDLRRARRKRSDIELQLTRRLQARAMDVARAEQSFQAVSNGKYPLPSEEENDDSTYFHDTTNHRNSALARFTSCSAGDWSEPEYEAENDQLVAIEKKIAKLKISVRNTATNFLKNGCDVYGALDALMQWQTNGGTIGVVGLISAVIGIHRLFERIRSESENRQREIVLLKARQKERERAALVLARLKLKEVGMIQRRRKSHGKRRSSKERERKV